MTEKFNGHALTPEQLAAGELFTKLVDERGGLDKLTQEDKDAINELIKKEVGWTEENLIK